MVSLTLIVVALIVLVAVVAVAIFLIVRANSGTTGSTGSTGSSCRSFCTTVNNACSAPGTLKTGFGTTGDTNCSAACRSTVSFISVPGCTAPQCNSIYCTPQATLYTNLKNDGTLFNFCDSGIGTAYPVTSCNQSLTAEQLGSLSVPTSSLTNAILNPVFITTTKFSIYQTSQPTATGGIPQRSIEVNLTDDTVISNPYVLYVSGGILSFQRIKDILNLGNVNQAIWIYNTDNSTLKLFQNVNQNFSINSLVLQQATPVTPYGGPNAPCGITTYVSPAVTTSVIYDPNPGLFSVVQPGQPIVGSVAGHLKVVNDNAGNFLVSADVENFSTPTPTCSSSNYARWYGISAINVFLGK